MTETGDSGRKISYWEGEKGLTEAKEVIGLEQLGRGWSYLEHRVRRNLTFRSTSK